MDSSSDTNPRSIAPRITITLDLSSDEAEELASSLTRATPSMLLPLTGLSGRPAVDMAARLAATLERLAKNLTSAGYPSERAR
jgi:hypothetical protein